MKVQDGQRWAEHVSDIRADGEAGQRFHTFYTFWFEATEKMLDDIQAESDARGPVFTGPTMVAEQMRKALELTENEFGYLSTELIGAMLAVAVMHWIHGEALQRGLTFIEHRAMEEAVARKLADLQNQAANASTTTPAAAAGDRPIGGNKTAMGGVTLEAVEHPQPDGSPESPDTQIPHGGERFGTT